MSAQYAEPSTPAPHGVGWSRVGDANAPALEEGGRVQERLT